MEVPAAAPTLAPARIPVAVREVLEIPAGRYRIGLDPSEAEFFNQTPGHEIVLEGFTIDRAASDLTGLTFDQAILHCEKFDLRLPSEAEWEVAAQTPGFVGAPGLYEWTVTWYQAYPGNDREEEAYGTTHRVLRRFDPGLPGTLYSRQFMTPDQSHPQVGFRCAASLD